MVLNNQPIQSYRFGCDNSLKSKTSSVALSTPSMPSGMISPTLRNIDILYYIVYILFMNLVSVLN